MATLMSLRIQEVGEFKYLLNGASFVCELPEWVDKTARVYMIQDVTTNESKMVLTQPNHAPVFFDRENQKWRPL